MTRDLLHLTLVFLGATDAGRLPQIESALATVATRHAPYTARTGEAGARIDDRPNARRGGVAWLRLADGGHETSRLALDVDAVLGGSEYDAIHSPRPHVTVARNVHHAEFEALREVGRTLHVEWLSSRIALFRSYTSPTGSRYEAISIHQLTA
jgi:2'-5' RNA ligase